MSALPTSALGSGGLSNIGGAVVSSIISGAFASSDAKKQREMEQELTKLSLAQQKELEIRLQDVNGELAKQEIIYEYLAIKKNNEGLLAIKNRRYTMYIALSLGAVAVSYVILKMLKK